MIDRAVALAVVLLAVAWLLRRAWRALAPVAGTGCGCGRRAGCPVVREARRVLEPGAAVCAPCPPVAADRWSAPAVLGAGPAGDEPPPAILRS